MTQNSFGVHGLVWVGSWGEDNARKAIEGAKAAGFDRLEIPLLESWQIDTLMTRKVLEEHNFAMTGNQFLTDDKDITSDDPDIRKRGVQFLTDSVDMVAEMGGDWMCGTMYSKLGKYDTAPTEQGRENCANALREVADHAQGTGVNLGLELCNRFETNMLNTAYQCLDMIERIDRSNVYVHLDTYHMNIEETDMMRPVLDCGDKLGYVHICEGHRGYLGSGNVHFADFFRALVQIDYKGPITFESFSAAVASPDLSNALCIWRNLWTDSMDLASHAKRFIDAQLKAAQTEPSMSN